MNYNNNNTQTLINGFTPGWSSISFIINGYVIKNISAISYSEAFDVQPVMGKGNKAVAYGIGNKTFTGSITIRKEELDVIRRSLIAAGKTSVLDIEPSPIVVTYLTPDGFLQTDTLKNTMFTSVDLSSTQGSVTIDINLPFIFSDLISILP